VLVLFEMTVDTPHTVKEERLASIWAEIPEELKETPHILVFVIPVEVAKTFPKQPIVPSVRKTSVGNHDFGKWEQYVLAVDAQRLWESHS